MAKRKISTDVSNVSKKKPVKNIGKSAPKKVDAPTVKEAAEVLSQLSLEEEPKRCLEVEDVDLEMKAVIKAMGVVQKKYQELGVSVKGGVVRSAIKSLRTRYKEWNINV